MSYQVLARKWRPGKFSELVGQEHVVSAISNALDNDRLHHAYLFTGTRGVGKTTIARIFSKSLNCEVGQGANPCGQCNTCKEIEQGNYVDLLEIDAASRTKVEDTRELLDNVQYKPTRGRYKVYLIDEVHMLSKHSFNALLKTLEEPPPHVKFLLATTDPQKLPITILSRCLQFNLKAMSREQIVGQLTHILDQEQLPFEQQALALLARAAQGSMRDALSLTDQAIAQGGNSVVASVVTDMLGLMDKSQLLKVIHAVVNKQPSDVMQMVNDISEQAPDYDNVHSELASLLHQIALTQWVPEACKLETTSAKAIYQLAKNIPAEQVQLMYQIALQGKKDLPFASDGKSAFEMTLMRMMTFAPSVLVSDTQSIIESQQASSDMPVSSHNPSGGPGNVSKQEEAHSSETLAETKQQSTPNATETSDTYTHKQVPESATPEPQEQLTQQEEAEKRLAPEVTLNEEQNKSSEAVLTSEVALNSETSINNPVLVTPSQTESSVTSLQDERAQTQTVETRTDENDKAFADGTAAFNDGPPLDAYMDDMPPPESDEEYMSSQVIDVNDMSTDSVSSQENAPSPEEQLTSTADMLALRQRLKQKKAEDADSKNTAATNEKTESAEQIQARFVKASTAVPTTPTSQVDGDVSLNENETAREDTQATSEQSHDTATQGIDDSASFARADESSAPDTRVSTETTEFNDFASEEFDADIPFANDENESVADASKQLQNGVSGQDNDDMPPWVTDSNVSEPKAEASQVDSEEQVNTAPDNASWEGVEFDAPLSDTYNGSLHAYLDNGSKLTHASQIDEWSNLVEQMPVAGLLKQLVLHASFSRHENTVSLEIHHSQTHLLNDGTKKQLIDALHQGLGENVDVVINLGEPSSTPFSLQQEIHAMRHAHAHTVIKTDDTIQALLSTFDASVLTDTVKAR